MDLMSMLMGAMSSGDSVNALSGKTGATNDQTSKLIQSALPLLMKSMTQNASTSDGAQSLFNALSQHTSTKSMGEQIANADEADGMKIIGHILGGNQQSVVSALAKESGMQEDQATKALGAMAPALLSGLSAATNNGKKDDKGGIDLSDLAGMFGGAQSGKTAGLTSILGSLLGGGGKDADASGTQLLSQMMSLMK